MGKRARERAISENEAKAVARLLRISPQKLNVVAGLIRGKKVSSAVADLEFSRKRIARDVRKCPHQKPHGPGRRRRRDPVVLQPRHNKAEGRRAARGRRAGPAALVRGSSPDL